ncbi:hypothetical protein ABEB36_014349 [Hypothenemus hampei]|uniref:Peptidoglycan-recognition protein n=1 Tax=Hypothenemus hampei TaxID=57062 RepID=A0ABD1E448_HYPHA
MPSVHNLFRLVLNLNIVTGLTVFFFGMATSFLEDEPEIVSREDWGANPPKSVQNLTLPVPFVVIHHSYRPLACETKNDCIKAMKSMQNYHQNNRLWNDIGYNFAAGGDSRIYVGRGWTAAGAHATNYNSKSIGICIIGDWEEQLPPEGQLKAVKELVEMGVKNGYISKDYKLIGHRQIKSKFMPSLIHLNYTLSFFRNGMSWTIPV